MKIFMVNILSGDSECYFSELIKAFIDINVAEDFKNTLEVKCEKLRKELDVLKEKRRKKTDPIWAEIRKNLHKSSKKLIPKLAELHRKYNKKEQELMEKLGIEDYIWHNFSTYDGVSFEIEQYELDETIKEFI